MPYHRFNGQHLPCGFREFCDRFDLPARLPRRGGSGLCTCQRGIAAGKAAAPEPPHRRGHRAVRRQPASPFR